MSDKTKKKRYSPTLDKMFGSGERKNREVDWGEVDRVLIGDLVAQCSEVGCAVLFGRTRDGGAWALTFFWDGLSENGSRGSKQSVYCNSADMLEGWLEEWIANWTLIAQEARSGD